MMQGCRICLVITAAHAYVPGMDNATVPVSMKLPSGLVARIDAAAEAAGRTRSGFVRRVLVETLEQHPAVGGGLILALTQSRPAPAGARVPRLLRRRGETFHDGARDDRRRPYRHPRAGDRRDRRHGRCGSRAPGIAARGRDDGDGRELAPASVARLAGGCRGCQPRRRCGARGRCAGALEVPDLTYSTRRAPATCGLTRAASSRSRSPHRLRRGATIWPLLSATSSTAPGSTTFYNEDERIRR